jgi:hypothetical protein
MELEFSLMILTTNMPRLTALKIIGGALQTKNTSK